LFDESTQSGWGMIVLPDKILRFTFLIAGQQNDAARMSSANPAHVQEVRTGEEICGTFTNIGPIITISVGLDEDGLYRERRFTPTGRATWL
jgi:hypothetical protein